MFTKLVILALAGLTAVLGFSTFRSRIPNGDRVPSPCPAGGIWGGVGHFNSSGGGPLNPFGEDFEAALFQWTVALCKLDSDKDGKTNGEELGDPNCVFTATGTATLGNPTGQPGICEPLNSAACKDQTVVCV
ncbi:temptin-like [Biomphalaria glabrata]|uniref:Temptin-like n=1 Tax=Biomphalaria glabrata TaxID=6526 RepID=A0A9U8EG57_BIOGL|nr:temptin-like [Biomphalaria glabrata]